MKCLTRLGLVGGTTEQLIIELYVTEEARRRRSNVAVGSIYGLPMRVLIYQGIPCTQRHLSP